MSKTLEQTSPVQETQVEKQERKRLQRTSLLDRILGDADRNSATYVKNYDVGRGAE